MLTIGNSPEPLLGFTVVKIVSIDPGPHAAMLLADIGGGNVIPIDRPSY